MKWKPAALCLSGARRRLEFAYDYLGRRIWKRETDLDASISFERKFVYDGWNLLAELDENNALVRSYVWGLDLSESRHGAGGVGGLLTVRNSDGSTHFAGGSGIAHFGEFSNFHFMLTTPGKVK